MAHKMAVMGLKYQYARLGGEQQILHDRERKLQKILDDANAQLIETKAELVSIQANRESVKQAAFVAFNVDISKTEPRRTWKKAHLSSWGNISRSILRRLKDAKGVPLTTAELAHNIDCTLGLRLDDAGLKKLQESIRYLLKSLRNRGAVMRVIDGHARGSFSTWVIGDFAE